jgi:hypothetical protein
MILDKWSIIRMSNPDEVFLKYERRAGLAKNFKRAGD